MSRVTVKINKVLMCFSENKGVFVDLEPNKLNVLYGSNTVGKSVLFSAVVAAFGSYSSLDRIVNNHMIKEDFQIVVDTSINGVDLILKLKNTSDQGKTTKIYEVRVNGEVETFSGTSEYTEYILQKINYPLMAAWDQDGKKILLSDILFPLYMRQESWKNSNLADSLELRFKPSNRISTSLAYHKGDESELFQKMNENIGLLSKWLNNKRVNGSKERILKELKRISTTDEEHNDDKFRRWVSTNEKSIELKARIREIKKAAIVGKIQREVKTEILTLLMDNKYSGILDPLTLQKIKNDIDCLMYAVGTDASKTETLKSLEQQLFICKNKLKDLSFDEKLGEIVIPKEIKNFIKKQITNSKEEVLSDQELVLVNQIKDNLSDLYYEIRFQFREATPKIINFTKGFQITQPGGTKGLKMAYEIIKVYKRFTADDSTFLLDSFFSEDEGEFDESSQDMLLEQVEQIKNIYDANVRGLVSFVYKEGLQEMMLKEMPDLNFIVWEDKKDTKLSTRELSDEAKEFLILHN